MDQVFAAGQLRFANLTAAELAQHARARDGVQQPQRLRQVPESQRPEPGRVQQARPIPPDQGAVPAVRPADLTQQSQLALALANAPTERPQAPDVQAAGRRGPPAVDLGGRGATATTAAGDRPTGPSVPAVEVPARETATSASDNRIAGDVADARNNGNAFGSPSDAPTADDAARQARFRELTARVNALQGTSGATAASAGDPAGAPANDVSAPPDVSQTGTTNGGAGPILPRGTNLSLVA
jgi:hypothetical protein